MRVSGVHPNYGKKQVSFGTAEEAERMKRVIDNHKISSSRLPGMIHRSDTTQAEKLDVIVPALERRFEKATGTEAGFIEGLIKKITKK